MKNTNRIHHKGATKTVKSQAKSPPEKTVTVICYSKDDDREFCRFEMPDVLYAAVLRAAKKMKITPGRFFGLAVEQKIARKLPASAKDRLSKAFDDTFSAIHPKPAVAS